MTRLEEEILGVVRKLGEAQPRVIGKKMDITSDYAEILCREMVRMGYFVKKGRAYKVK